MPDFRLYRIAFAPTLLAFVALMFSLQGIPAPIEPVVPPASFEPGRAAGTARAIVAAAPERPPGSRGDSAIADLVAERFGMIRAGTVSEQRLETSHDGGGVTLRSVVLTLPGDSAATVVVLAARDSAHGPGAASSAAATSALIELAAALGGSSHAKSYVLASTSGYAGGAGAEAVIEALPDPEAVEAVVVLSQPGAAEPRPPFVVTSSTGPNRTAAQLRSTAEQAVADQAGVEDDGTGALTELARLAFPVGLGLQAPLIDAGIDAVAISSAGERPLEPGEDTLDDLSAETLGGFGRAATSVIQALDAAPQPLEHGPEPYIEAGGNLVPGWAIALLALALLLPAGVAAADACARAIRRREHLAAGLASAAAKAAPALAGLVLLYFLAVIGVVPRPAFPFDPGRFGPDAAAAGSVVLVVLAMVAAGLLTGGRAGPDATRSSLLAGAGAVSVAGGLIAWLSNPYLGLLLVPAAHAWIVPATGARLAATAIAVAVALAPLAAGLAAIASTLSLGSAAPWTFLVTVATGQVGFWTAASICILSGGLAGALAASARNPGASAGALGARP